MRKGIKSCTKLVVRFSKLDILKMSIFQKVEENVCGKCDFTRSSGKIPKKSFNFCYHNFFIFF